MASECTFLAKKFSSVSIPYLKYQHWSDSFQYNCTVQFKASSWNYLLILEPGVLNVHLELHLESIDGNFRGQQKGQHKPPNFNASNGCISKHTLCWHAANFFRVLSLPLFVYFLVSSLSLSLSSGSLTDSRNVIVDDSWIIQGSPLFFFCRG